MTYQPDPKKDALIRGRIREILHEEMNDEHGGFLPMLASIGADVIRSMGAKKHPQTPPKKKLHKKAHKKGGFIESGMGLMGASLMGAGLIGDGLTGGELVGAGKPKKGKGLVGAGKKRKTNARANIVKKVMKEHGLSMIEASKYVKEHGLY